MHTAGCLSVVIRPAPRGHKRQQLQTARRTTSPSPCTCSHRSTYRSQDSPLHMLYQAPATHNRRIPCLDEASSRQAEKGIPPRHTAPRPTHPPPRSRHLTDRDRKRVVSGKGVAVRVNIGGGSI